MPPSTTSTSCSSTILDAAAAAASSSVALSSTISSSWRPSSPPVELMSETTMSATFALAMPMKDRAPVRSVITPTLMGSVLDVVIASSRLDGAGEAERVRLAQVAGFLHHGRDGRVGDEALPAGVVPVEDDP